MRNQSERRIKVLAAASQEALEATGADVEFEFDTLADAKRRAKYYLTDDYRQVCNVTECLGYAQVLVDGEVVADYFGGGR